MSRLLWVVPEEKGGIRSYADALWPAIQSLWPGEPLGQVHYLPQGEELRALKPDLIHVQHEYGLFGAKIPGFYNFPHWLHEVRSALPQAKIIATAHTVLGADYKYPLSDRGWQIPFRFLANQFLLPQMREAWGPETWGSLDGLIVHSATQLETVRVAGCKRVVEIPHFVFERQDLSPAPKTEKPEILVLGYLTPEKGQDIAIRAFAQLKIPAKLVLAGGSRRSADHRYKRSCESLIQYLKLQDQVEITGYVDDLNPFFARAQLVLAPFRETSGSGTLGQAFARGAAILASDLPLNREIELRQPACIELFRSEAPMDCARKIEKILAEPGTLDSLKQNAALYADRYSIDKTAEKHLEFYL